MNRFSSRDYSQFKVNSTGSRYTTLWSSFISSLYFPQEVSTVQPRICKTTKILASSTIWTRNSTPLMNVTFSPKRFTWVLLLNFTWNTFYKSKGTQNVVVLLWEVLFLILNSKDVMNCSVSSRFSSEFPGCILPELLWLLPTEVFHSRERSELCVLQTKHGAQVNSALPNQDGIPGDYLLSLLCLRSFH